MRQFKNGFGIKMSSLWHACSNICCPQTRFDTARSPQQKLSRRKAARMVLFRLRQTVIGLKNKNKNKISQWPHMLFKVNLKSNDRCKACKLGFWLYLALNSVFTPHSSAPATLSSSLAPGRTRHLVASGIITYHSPCLQHPSPKYSLSLLPWLL